MGWYVAGTYTMMAVHIDDATFTEDGRIDVVKLRPIARLGYKDYASVESVFEMEKRMPEDLLGTNAGRNARATVK
jgi:hypothetical protein